MRYFVTLLEEAHFWRAAARLKIAQPPLSQAIQRLEAELGVALLDRSRRSVQLTEAGEVFLKQARQTLQQAELAQTLTIRTGLAKPEVHVGFIGPALYSLIPDLLRHIRSEQGDTLFRLFERGTLNQMANLLAGQLDVGLVSSSVGRSDEFEILPVERSKFVAIVPANSPLANETSVTLKQLADHPFILPPKTQLAYAPDIITLFQREGVVPQVIQETLQTNTTLNLVAAGMGCSLVCATAAAMPPRNVRFIPLKLPAGSTAYYEIALIWLPGHLREQSENFIESTKAFIKARPKLLDPDVIFETYGSH